MTTISRESVIEQVKALPQEALPALSEFASYLASLQKGNPDWKARRAMTLREFNDDRYAIASAMKPALEQMQANAAEEKLSSAGIDAEIDTAVAEVRPRRDNQ